MTDQHVGAAFDALDATGVGSTASLIVVDTSALIADPTALDAFPDADIVVPLIVVEELDKLKGRPDDVGRAAREVLRTLEDLRRAHGGDLRQPVPLPGGSTFCVEPNRVHASALREFGLDVDRPDNRILAAAAGQATGGRPVTVVSNDAALRLKAAQLGLEAVEHERASRAGEYTDSGWRDLAVSSGLIDALFARRLLPADDWGPDADAVTSLRINEFAVLRCGGQSALSRRTVDGLTLTSDDSAWGLHPRSKEQRFALDLLLDPDIRIVALDGAAGTGKTILAMAAGLEQVVEPSRARYGKVSVFRPIIPVGKQELGFLPGDLDDKLDPWMAAVNDALVGLSSRHSEQDAQTLVDELRARRQLTTESVTFLRGRSLVNTFVLVDEAQNLEPPTLKTILTRIGEGSKVVFTGDVSQIDQPYLSSRTNALSVLVDRFAGQPLFGHARLTACERSAVADLAAKLLT